MRTRSKSKFLAMLLAISLTLGLVWVPALAASETIANETGNSRVDDVDYFGQSFTPANPIEVTSVEFYMRSASSMGFARDVRVSIRTSGGTVLGTSGTTSVSTSEGWKTFTFATPVQLAAGTEYYAVVSYTSRDVDYWYSSTSLYTGGTRLTSSNGSSWSSASGDLRFRIQNTIIGEVTVTFDKNGGDTNAVPSSVTTDFNTTVTLPEPPTREGYLFNGWNTAANGYGDAFTASTPVTGNLTVYAQWIDTSILPDGSIVIGKSTNPFDTYSMTDPFDLLSKLADHRKTDVTLTVEAVPLHKPIDLVIVLDISNSMDDSPTKLADMKTAAKTLAMRVIENHPLSRVSVVKYGSDAYAYNFGTLPGWRFFDDITGGSGRSYFTHNLTAVEAVVDGLSISGGNDGGTNTEGGFLAADNVMELEGRTDAEFLAEAATTGQRVIAFMTDGVPTYRYDGTTATSDGSGTQSSAAELNEAIAAGVAARTHSKAGTNGSVKIFTVGLIEGLSTFQTTVARFLLRDQAHVDSISWSSGTISSTANPALDYEFRYYETTTSSALNEIYYTISGMIDQVATNAVVTDIVSAEWELDTGSFLVGGAAPAPGEVTTVNNPDGTTTITWTIGDLYPAGTELTYTLTGKAPYYGVADTNDAATLTFTHVMPTPPEGSTSPMTFPVPEAELNAFTVNDSYGVAWNSSVEFDVRLNDPAANTVVDQSDVFTVPGVAEMTPMYGALTYSRAGVSGSLSYDSVTQKFTYTPNGALIESDYTVTFPYYLTQTTGSGDSTLVMMSEPALVTITVYSPTYLVVSKTNTGGNPDHLFTFTVTIGGVLYNGPATVTTLGEPGSDSVTITDGILTLKGGQSARIDGIAVGASYVVTETARDGYTPAPASGEVSGTLTADGATASFTNDYAASGSVTLSGTKFLDGRKLKASEFTFEVYEGSAATGTPILTAVNALNGDYAFDPILYDMTDLGLHTYTVVEKAGTTLGGIDYDDTEYTVQVNVSDNGDGTLHIVKSENFDDLDFTNTYSSTGEVEMSGQKSLTGRKQTAGEFVFELFEGTDTAGTAFRTATNAADGTYSFTAIEYGLDDVGTKTYTVRERNNGLGGVTYDTQTYTVTVDIKDNGDGTLDVDPSSNYNALNFTNAYAATGSLTLAGQKALTGRTLVPGEFTFEVYLGEKATGTPIRTATNGTGGVISFTAIPYTLADVGSKTYTVVEKVGSLGGVTYDTTEYTVTVTIADGGNGQLTVTPSTNYDDLDFNNTYAASGSLTLSGQKTLSGRTLVPGEFTFEVYPGDSATGTPIRTTTNGTGGVISFAPIPYTLTDVGLKTYTVVEKLGSLGGVTYATNSYEVTVTIADGGNGQLTVTPSANYNMLNFTNTYGATGSVTLSGQKTLDGRDLIDGEFTFEVYLGGIATGTPIRTATNGTGGVITFDPILYTLADVGIKTYTVVEKAGTLGGVTYDTTEYTVTVTIADAGNGQLTVTPSANHDDLDFDNTYAASGDVTFSGLKTLAGRDLEAGEFTFELYAGASAAGTPIDTATHLADGTYAFQKITYTLADVKNSPFTYTVKEASGTVGGVVYATNTYTITVTLADKGDGTLTVTPSANYDDLDFTNTYGATGSVTLSGTKTLTGRDLAVDEFTFELYAGSSATGTPIDTVTNAADGTFAFAQINYILSDVGTKTYTVVEKAGTLGGVTYDTTDYTVTVTISDKGDGSLTVTPSVNYNALDFENEYAATGSLDLSGTKTLNGRDLDAGEFSFELWEGLVKLETVTHDGDGDFSFTAIGYTLADVKNSPFTYTVKEAAGTLGGVSYSDTEYTVVVHISDNGDGTLAVTLDDESAAADALDFTNDYAATGSLTLSGTKTLTGRDLTAGEFSFELWIDGILVETATHDGDGDFSFQTIDYTLADVGEHTYTVKEAAGTLGGVTYNTTVYTVIVDVSDNGDGTLAVTEDEESDAADALDFTNRYVATGSLDLSGTKTLNGRDLIDGEFTFELWKNGLLVESVTNDGNGDFSFKTLTFGLSDVGDHTYTVVENEGTLGGVTYDQHVYSVTVTVSDKGNGTLDVTVSETSDDPTALDFENDYAADGSLDLSGTKTLTGRDLDAGEFSFELWEDLVKLETVTHDVNGDFSFTTLDYDLDDVGTKTYTVKEVAGTLGGVTYSDTEYTVVVHISDNGNGTLAVTLDEESADPDALDFENTYAATGGLDLSGTKTLNGRDLIAGEFTFELWIDGILVETATNDGDGDFSFLTIQYTLANVGEHTYTVKEASGALGGVTYDTTVYTVIVDVSDNGDGTLAVTEDEESDDPTALDFTNEYEAEGSLDLSGTKTLTGRDLIAGEFTFELWEDLVKLETVTHDGDGDFAFTTLDYDLTDVGTKTYTVVETAGTLGGVTYDTTEYTVEVTISDNGDGTLDVTASETSDDPTALDFANDYDAEGGIVLTVLKDLAGRALTAGEFTFELWEIEGEAALQSVTNLADGTVTFGEIVYTEADVGTHYYMIVEQAGSEAGMLYDPMVVFVVVEVTDNGDGTLTAEPEYTTDVEFNNLYQDPELSLVKVAQNLTTGGPAVDGSVVTSVVGDLILYTVTVRNEGNMPLYDAVLTDDLALAGTAVEIDGVATVWLAGTPYAYVELGTLAVGQEVVLTYEYTMTEADAEAEIRVNIAAVDANALMAVYLEPQEQVLAASEGDQADPRVSAYILPLHAEDDAIVTAEEIPLVGTPSIQVEKDVRNQTKSGSFGPAAGGNPGDVFEYRIVVTNTGDFWLADVLVHDDRAAIGGSVLVNGVAKVWIAGTDGKAMVNIGGLAPAAKATLTYTYTSVDADVDLARVNTAVAEAVVPELIGTEMPSKVTSQPDTAMILVDKIPESGELGTGTRMIGGAALLMAGTAGVVAIRRRKRDEEEIEA